MRTSAYLKSIDNMFQSRLVCRCCGSAVYLLSNQKESICNFCEAYVREDDGLMLSSNSELSETFLKMQQSVLSNNWQDGIACADLLVMTKDPYLLFGASSFYRFFSDFTYNQMDYTQEGFMYSNAAKRSDEPKNKNNAMDLISKSKGCLFKAMKLIAAEGSVPETSLAHINFISNMNLKRHAAAARNLAALNAAATVPGAVKTYANMVFSVESKDRKSARYISDSLNLGITNSFYYAAKDMALHGHLNDAITVLGKLAAKTNMQSALYFLGRLKNVKAASEM